VAAPVLREMLLEARLVEAADALRLGLVHEVVPDDQVEAVVQRRAERLAELSPAAARLNKQTLRQLAGGGPSPGERRAHFRYADSPDHREGVTAFLEKRPPRFQRG
jgi:enoyl-CoA hydratase/carnithine racemase